MNIKVLLQLCKVKGYQTFLLFIMEVLTVHVVTVSIYCCPSIFFLRFFSDQWQSDRISKFNRIFFMINCRSDLQMYQCLLSFYSVTQH